MSSRRAMALLSPFVALLSGCGLEAVFGPDEFAATPPDRVRIAFTAPTGAVTVEAWDAEDQILGQVAAGDGQGVIDLGAGRDLFGVRLCARDGAASVVARLTLAQAPARADTHDAGTMDRATTAAALLLEGRLAYEGLTLGATPAPVAVAILQQAGANDDPSLAAFRDLVPSLLGSGALEPLGAALAPGWVAGHPDEAAAYERALAAAVAKVGVPIVCDPALVRVMFAVDITGQALDGNGSRQFIRQPPKEGKVYLGFTVEDSSPVTDAAGALPSRLTPNDPTYVMSDDGPGGSSGDEVAGDGVFTRVLTLPRGMRIIYKYTDGSAGEGFTRTEEWPGNARILQVDDVLTRRTDGQPDCLVIRRDSFGDESTNKNFTSLASALRGAGGALAWETDLGGSPATPLGDGRFAGGLGLYDPRAVPPLSPRGVPESRENGICTKCPAPLALAIADTVAPRLLGAAFRSTTEIEIRFSEAMDFASAQDPSAYAVVDSALRALPILGVASLGDRVRLRVDGPDLAEAYTLHVRPLADASSARNLLAGSQTVVVRPDVTPPRPISAVAASRKDLDAAAVLTDPTIGDVVIVTFSEELLPQAAEDVGHYLVETIFGERLAVRAAFLRDRTRVFLVTDSQTKRLKYQVDVMAMQDFAGNVQPPSEPLPFEGFALYRMTFGVVPGHAFSSRDGSVRGIPRGERLYLTGTPLSVARDPADGTSISIPGRTDVTGVPEFELTPGQGSHEGKPIFNITLLVPPGIYAWKAAHGAEGEWQEPPPTLEKVTKSLGTTNDPTGVNVDPVTLVARNGVSFEGAVVSQSGADRPGPGVLFKRENPDEICEVSDSDVHCPTIVVGTWRDLDDFVVGGLLHDYDDGQPEVPPVRLLPDTAPPAAIYVAVRDSESLRITFDEGIAQGATITATAASADAKGLGIVELLGRNPEPHEIVIRTDAQTPDTEYVLELSGLADDLGNTYAGPLALAWRSPAGFVPFTPFEDTEPPILLSAVPESPTSLRVSFNEKLAGGAADLSHYSIKTRDAALPPSIVGGILAGNGKEVVLTTTPQALMGQLTLEAVSIQDLASPANVLASAAVDFVGFGDLTPPVLTYARAIGPQKLVLAFDEALDLTSASSVASYMVPGATVVAVEFSGDPELMASAFDPGDAPYVRNLVVVSTSPIAAGTSTMVTAQVRDRSGNPGGGSLSIASVATSPRIDVVLEVQVSDTQTIAGAVPPRTLPLARLLAEREGIFVVGPSGFPPEGSPLDGVEPRLMDDGTGGDLTAGDGIYTITVANVALGETVEWKAFAPYTVAWKSAHPVDASAAFADALPGPSVFSDGQEFPGNENGVRVLGDTNGDGRLRIRALFGDETSYKKLKLTPAFVWAIEDVAYAP